MHLLYGTLSQTNEYKITHTKLPIMFYSYSRTSRVTFKKCTLNLPLLSHRRHLTWLALLHYLSFQYSYLTSLPYDRGLSYQPNHVCTPHSPKDWPIVPSQAFTIQLSALLQCIYHRLRHLYSASVLYLYRYGVEWYLRTRIYTYLQADLYRSLVEDSVAQERVVVVAHKQWHIPTS